MTTALSLVVCLRNCKWGNLALHARDSPVYLPKICCIILVVSVSTKIGRPTAGMADQLVIGKGTRVKFSFHQFLNLALIYILPLSLSLQLESLNSMVSIDENGLIRGFLCP